MVLSLFVLQYAAFVTLFMLMIQNNWVCPTTVILSIQVTGVCQHVTVDGYVKCSGERSARWFFITFNLVRANLLQFSADHARMYRLLHW